jgi:hypothetical protein
MELLNSSAQQSDMMSVYRGWFSLLNAGHRITGVGSSDGHDVSRYIIGQGRTYIRCDDRDPGHIDIRQACDHLKAGHALVSMGLLTEMVVDQTCRSGDLAPSQGATLDVTVTVQGPTWTTPDHVALYANGVLIRERSVALSDAPGLKTRIEWRLPKPRHDVYLVAMATGPGVIAPYWAIPRPYQSSATAWTPRVAGSTNPIWIDADGDQAFTSARAYAERLAAAQGNHAADMIRALDEGGFDASVAIQAAVLCRARGEILDSTAIQAALKAASAPVRAGFEAYRSSVTEPSRF